MKKFILLCVAFLSALGTQAALAANTITYNGVTYSLDTQSIHDGAPIPVSNKLFATSPDYNASSSGTLKLQNEVVYNQTVTTTYNATATSIENSSYSITIDDFTTSIKHDGTAVVTDTIIDYTDADYAGYMGRAKNAGYVYDHSYMSGHQVEFSGFYYYEYNEDLEKWEVAKSSSWTTLVQNYSAYDSVFYSIYVNGKNKKFCYAMPYINITKVETINLKDSIICNVVAIDQNCKLGSNAATVVLGQRIQSIPDNSFFADATNLAAIIVAPGNNYLTYENGILYGNFYAGSEVTKYQDKLITGTTSTVSQTIPETVKTVYTDAFKNAPEGVIITCMNYQLTINGNDNYVIFLLPSTEAQIQGGKNGGYIIEGNLTQAHIDQLEIKGTFMDFTEANILSNIHFNNGSNPINTLLYFSNPANSVTGDKNVIIDGQCDSCVITDNGSDEFYCPTAFRAKKLTYTRKFDDMWKTTSLPFSLPSSKLKNKLIIGELNDFYYENYYMYDFLYSTSLNAYIPYIVKTKEVGDTVKFENLENIDIEVTAPIEYSFDEDRGKFIPVFKTQVLTSSTAAFNYYGIQNIWKEEQNCWGNYMQIFEGVTIRPFRAYLVGPKMDSSVAKYRLLDANNRVIEEGEFDVTSAIETVKSVETENTKATYNLNGQRVNNTRRGLNVIDGKVILNK